MRFVIHLRHYLLVSDHLDNGIAAYDKALAIVEDERQRATILNVLGALFYRRSRLPEAHDHWARSLAIWQDLGDEVPQATALHNLVLCHLESKNFADARARLEQARDLYLKGGDLDRATACEFSLGRVMLDAGQPEKSVDILTRAIESNTTADPTRLTSAFANLALANYVLGNWRQSLLHLKSALRHFDLSEDIASVSPGIVVLARLAELNGLRDEGCELRHWLAVMQGSNRFELTDVEQEILHPLNVTGSLLERPWTHSIRQVASSICNKLDSVIV